MSQLQGWTAIALAVVTLVSVLFMLGYNFGTIKMKVDHIAEIVQNGFVRINTRLDKHSTRLDKHTDEISELHEKKADRESSG